MPTIDAVLDGDTWLVVLPDGREVRCSDEFAVVRLVATEACGATPMYRFPIPRPTSSSGPDFAAAGYAVQQRQGPSPAPGVGPSSPAAAYPPVAAAGTITAAE